MKSIFNPDNKFGRLITKIGYVIILSWVWLVFCLPIVTVGAASTALYDVMRKALKDEEGMILQDYWRSFKSNFKQCTPLWLLVMAAFAVILYMVGLLWIIHDTTSMGLLVTVVYAVVVVTIAVWVQVVFSYIARFEDTVKTATKNAFLMCLMNPVTLLWVGFLTAAVAYCLYVLPLMPYLPLIFSLLPGGYCALLTVPMEKMFAKYIQAAPEQQEEE